MAHLIRVIFLALSFLLYLNTPVQSSDDFIINYQYFNKSTGYYEEVNKPVYEDSLGFVWLYGTDGLYRFDGTHMELMLSASDTINGTSISRMLGPLYDAGNGKIWIKYGNTGFIKYTPSSKELEFHELELSVENLSWINKHQFWFSSFRFKKETNESAFIIGLYDLNSNYLLKSFQVPYRDGNIANGISRILVNHKENGLWLAAESGLIYLNIDSGTFTPYAPSDYPGLWGFRECHDLAYDDSHGKIWLDYAFGPYLYSFDPNLKKFDPVYDKIKNFRFNDIRRIINDNNYLWIIDSHDELLLLNKQNFTVKKVLSKEKPLHYIGNIYQLFQDRNGNIWVGGSLGTVRINRNPKLFTTMFIPNFNAQFRKQGHARNMLITKSDEFWVASQQKLLKYDATNNSFSGINTNWESGCGWIDTTQNNSNQIAIITSIDEDNEGSIWMSSTNCIQRLDPKTYNQDYFWPFNENHSQRRYPLFRDMAFDSLNFMWGAGMDLGIARFDPKTHESFLISHKSKWGKRFGLGFIFKIEFSKDYEIIIQSGNLLTINVVKDSNPNDVNIDDFELVKLISDEQYQRASGKPDTVWQCLNFCLDDRNKLWTITNKILFEFDLNSRGLVRHGLLDQVLENGTSKLITDKKNRIWLFGNSGIYCYDPFEKKIKYFSKAEGVPWYSFVYGHTLARDIKGRIYAWTMEGLFYFDPDDLMNTYQDPKIVITGLKINDQKIYAGASSPISKDIILNPQISLNYTHKTLSLNYSVLNNYGNPGDFRYRYMLVGFDVDWINAGNRTYLGYSNIPPGDYVLKINTTKSNYFEDANEIKLSVHMATAPWLTWWAYTGYGIFILAIVISIVGLYINKERKAQRIILEQNELKKTKEIEKAKTVFFTNISHEFRTPLTLIIDPLRSLIKGESVGEESQLYRLMLKNAHKLKAMIDQILDVSKIEANEMTIRVQSIEVSSFTRQVLSNFNSTANSRDIRFDFQAPLDPVYAWIDEDKYEKILNNLLSNAFKFTRKGGSINVRIDTIKTKPDSNRATFFKLIVEDTGIGISKEKTNNIFNRFYQADTDQHNGMTGTGIGLSLVREFIKLHHGNIEVESQPGEGTKFIVTLPLGKEHYNTKEVHETDIDYLVREDLKTRDLPSVSIQLGTPKDAPLLLIVDDHPDMLKYIKGKLQKKYDLLEAENGVVAFELAVEQIPDLIISDVMMPEMDGFELCKKLKEDHRTCHIPIVLLTAKTDKESKIDGLGVGADDYIQKPFDLDILIARTNNLIHQRNNLRKIFKEDLLLNKKGVKLQSKDEKLITRLVEIVENYIDDPDLSIEELATKIGLSRTQLYRKLLALCNQKPTEFIRIIRLKKAAELISNDYGNISEIAYSVGFSNLSYFSESFKKEYGVTPMQYKIRSQNDKMDQ